MALRRDGHTPFLGIVVLPLFLFVLVDVGHGDVGAVAGRLRRYCRPHHILLIIIYNRLFAIV